MFFLWCWKRVRCKMCLDICALFVCVRFFSSSSSCFCFECKVFAQPQLECLSGTKLCVWYALRWDVFYAKCELCRNDATLKKQKKKKKIYPPDTMRLGKKQPKKKQHRRWKKEIKKQLHRKYLWCYCFVVVWGAPRYLQNTKVFLAENCILLWCFFFSLHLPKTFSIIYT